MCTLAGGSQAVNELQVFLRAVSATQRRWAKRIASQEAKVRRLMIFEDNCRKKLRKSVLRSTNEQLKYLVSTDPLGSMEVKLPPRGAFSAFNIPAKQASGFSVFAMARLHSFPAAVPEVSQMSFIADLLSAWEILPPRKKEKYEAFAESIRHSSTGSFLGPNDDQSSTNIMEEDNSTWESRAYSSFLREGRRQLEASVGPLKDSDWLSTAPKEWESLTLRQKRVYLPQ
ncbi:hypothetical protein LSM04_003677 [Trypanosoma melophagium]|uniref:uncharacterized protein n=1 Tax=Trypanosoma melophagium TaxID=715481 RepID=UPI003519E0D7|nr:hypothetical protein LSM04_003677 [Trypanosoma melophagium]